MQNDLLVVKDGGLYIDGMPVQQVRWKEGEELPSLFVIRVKGKRDDDSDAWRFVCGFDLCYEKNLFWLGANEWKVGYERFYVSPAYYDRFYTIRNILDRFVEDTQGKEWAIFQEEEFLQDNDWQMDDCD